MLGKVQDADNALRRNAVVAGKCIVLQCAEQSYNRPSFRFL